jgi:hypothetical protein|nr:MAG TPA: hypothetical protein [Caudoviricetes sp.]
MGVSSNSGYPYSDELRDLAIRAIEYTYDAHGVPEPGPHNTWELTYDFTLESENLVAEFRYTASGFTDPGDYLTPPDDVTTSESIEVLSVETEDGYDSNLVDMLSKLIRSFK